MNDHNRGFFYAGVTAVSLGALLASQQATAEARLQYDQKIFALEHALIGVGYELQAVDGLMDPQTHQALIDYQKKHNFTNSTGSVTDETLVALGIQAQAPQAPEAQTAVKARGVETFGVSARPNETVRIKPIEAAPAVETSDEDNGWLFF